MTPLKLWSLCLCVLIASACLPASAQHWAKERLDTSPRHLEWVDVKSGDRTIKTFIAYPEVKQKATVVILIHEIFGLSDWIRSTADELAEQGFIAAAPDLLSGTVDGGGGTEAYTSEDDIRKAVSGLPAQQVTNDLNAVFDYAKEKIPAANGKIAVAGFCWGGGQAFRYATNNRKIKAAFVFYGPAPETQDMKQIAAPVYGFYAENDARITSTVDKTTAAMKKAHKKFKPVIYKNAGHGFMRTGEDYDMDEGTRDARTTAWQRFISLLRSL